MRDRVTARWRASARLTLILASCVGVAACGISTTPATNITATTATLNAEGSCVSGNPTPCQYYVEYGTVASGGFSSTTPASAPCGPSASCDTDGNVALSANVTRLAPATAMHYKICGKGDGVSNYTCVGTSANGSPASLFTTSGAATTKTDCFASPGSCGYPDPATGNVGAKCSELAAFNPNSAPANTYYNASTKTLSPTAANVTIANTNLGDLHIYDAENGMTLTDDCIVFNGGGTGNGTLLVNSAAGYSGLTITNSTIEGANSTNESVDGGIQMSTGTGTATDDVVTNCGECVHGTWNLTQSYVDADAQISGEHQEDVYINNQAFTASDDTLLNPEYQTAVIFGDQQQNGGSCASGGTNCPATNRISVTNSLLAGGGFLMYPDSNSNTVGTSSLTVTGDRIARCTTEPATYQPAHGGKTCGSADLAGADGFGYWPQAGYFGLLDSAYCSAASTTWSGDVWDDDNATIGCAS